MSDKLERIKNGTQPTVILREMMAAEPGISHSKLGYRFMEDIPRLPGGVTIAIPRWKEFLEGGCEDATLDWVILSMMRRGGLL